MIQNHRPTRDVQDYEKMNKIGEGTYGTVYRARDTRSNDIVALKRVRNHAAKEGFPKTALREIRVLQTLNHPNIVELHDVAVGKQADSIFLVFEYCEHDVAALLDHMDKPFSVAEVKCISLQLLAAVEHLHHNFILHRDIKLSNLLLTNRGIVKLADFGLARDFSNPSTPCTVNVVTLWYRGPELLFGDSRYSSPLDMWAVGCIIGELLHHSPILPGKNEQDQIDLICGLLGSPNPKIWPEIVDLPLFEKFDIPRQTYSNLQYRFPDESDGCIELLNKLLCYDPRKRLSASQALASVWFSERPKPAKPSTMPTFREHRNDNAQPTHRPNIQKSGGIGLRPRANTAFDHVVKRVRRL